METHPSERVTCPSCGQGYRWQQAHIGKQVPCKTCGVTFIIPDTPGVGLAVAPETAEPEDAGVYELAEPSEPDLPSARETHATPAKDGKCPSCNSPVEDHAVVCLNCGFNMAEGKRMETDIAAPLSPEEAEENQEQLTKREKREQERIADALAEHHWREYKLPMILLGIGVVLGVLNLIMAPLSKYTSYGMTDPMNIRIATLLLTGISVLVNSVLIFCGLFALIALFGASFGALGSVLLKILAIVFMAGETTFFMIIIADLALGAGVIVYILDWLIYIGLMLIFSIKLLDLDMAESRVMLAVFVVGHALMRFVIITALMALF